ncbi:uncharacterized protein LOC126893554 isoform X2 [Daktulosphaira vitifoliae]|uniref:uncharacterized protein LOC126893554 isoform X2 n=1 Tax=Daktulosphaira vitifoliae TaxID=58002 RepID=UPI0021A9B8EA|nr:uncharacterized protein LOC126893554 isoform X2 [Daktulosphaira vitifoliae]XP_050519830.1 uncharacterized protein LOC126893554 isoform X2 [Daktulosphaira vitifoliae]
MVSITMFPLFLVVISVLIVLPSWELPSSSNNDSKRKRPDDVAKNDIDVEKKPKSNSCEDCKNIVYSKKFYAILYPCKHEFCTNCACRIINNDKICFTCNKLVTHGIHY